MDVTLAGSAVNRTATSDQLGRVTIELSADGEEVGTGTIVIDDVVGADEIRGGRQCKVEEGATLLTDGFIGMQDRARGSNPATPHREDIYQIEDANRLFYGMRFVNRSRPAETDQARVLAFAAIDLPSAVTTQVLSSNLVTLPAKKYTGSDWLELIRDVSEASGKRVFLHDKADGTGRCLHSHRDNEGHTSGLTISDVLGTASATTFYPTAPNRNRVSSSALTNDVYGKDQAGRTATATDSGSITAHDADGLTHKSFVDFDAASQSELDAKVAQWLAENKEETDSYTCSLLRLDENALALIRAGDRIPVTSQAMALTASTIRIAHLSLTISRGDDGKPMKGYWDAYLELNTAIKLRGRRSSGSKPVTLGDLVPAGPISLVGTDLGTEHWTNADYTEYISRRVSGGSSTFNPLIADPIGDRTWDLSGTLGAAGRVYLGRTFIRHVAPGGATVARLRASVLTTHINAGDPPSVTPTVYAGANGPWSGGSPAAWTDVADVRWQRVTTSGASPVFAGPFLLECIIPVVGGNVQFVMADAGLATEPPSEDAQWASYLTAQYQPTGGADKYELTFFTDAAAVAGQQTIKIPIATGDGLETIFQTPFPYVPGTLEVDVEGEAQAPVETNPATGALTLPYAPPTGYVVYASFVIATSEQTGVPITPPSRELGPVPGSGILDVAAANSAGVSRDYASDDHAHEGVHQITADGGALVGDLILAAGTNVTITRASQTVTFAATGGGGSGGWNTYSTDSVQMDTGRYTMYGADLDANITLGGGVYIISVGFAIELQPDSGQVVDINTGDGLVLPRINGGVDPTALDEGQLYYDQDNTRLRAYINGNWVTLPWMSTSGQAQITSGNTSVTVTHGSFDPVTARGVAIWPTNNPTNDPGWFWVSNIGATTFDINVRANPGASGAFFAWRIVPQ